MVESNKQYKMFFGITSIFLILLMTVFLFYVGTKEYQGITDAKFSVFRIVCGGYIFLMGLLLIESIVVGEFRVGRGLLKKMSITQKLVVCYILLTWISAIFSPYFPETIWGMTRFEGAMTISIYGICFILVSVFGEISKRLLFVLGTSVSLFCILCIIQLSGKNPMGLYPEGLTYFDGYIKYAGAYLGTIGNVDLVAAFLSLMIPLLWIGLLRLSEKWKFLLMIPLGLSLFVLLKMFVLAGLVAVFAGGLLTLPVIVTGSAKKKKFLAGIVCFLFTAVLGLVYLLDVGNGMLHEIHQILHGDFDGGFGSGRLHIWKSVLTEIPKHLLLGTGPDTMAYADFEAFTRYDVSLGKTIVTHIDIAHNEYLNILFHQGLPALVVYLVLLGALAVKWIRQSEKDAVTAMLGGATFCYCVQAFFGFSMIMTAPYFWVILGLLDKRTRWGDK